MSTVSFFLTVYIKIHSQYWTFTKCSSNLPSFSLNHIWPPSPLLLINCIFAVMYFRLSKAAVSRYKKLKEQSTAGLKDIVAHHKYTEVGIHTHASGVQYMTRRSWQGAGSNNWSTTLLISSIYISVHVYCTHEFNKVICSLRWSLLRLLAAIADKFLQDMHI